MRFAICGFVLLVALRAALAQPAGETLEQRVERLEREIAALREAQPSPVPSVAHAAGSVHPLASLGDEGAAKTATKAAVTVGGYAEVFYQWNFNEPSNGITNYRGFDNRHNAFTIANAVIDAQGTLGPVSAHLALQYGHTPDTYYLAEPAQPGTAGANASGAFLWKFIQQANVAWTAPLGRGLTVDAGIFLSPIGPEGMAVKDQWNWSRSNLFFGLPFYHTGFRITYPFTDRLTASFQVYNGWNSVVDNNAAKSLAAQLTYSIADKLTWQFIYFTGVERASGAREGQPWRHLFDSYLALYPRAWAALLLHADGGFEPNTFGTSGWLTGALYLRFQPLAWLYVGARGDLFYEWVPTGAAPIFWNGSQWISSGTATIDFRPAQNLSFRIEYRHDQSQLPLFFRDQVGMDLMGNMIPNAHSQNTVTAGAVAWF